MLSKQIRNQVLKTMSAYMEEGLPEAEALEAARSKHQDLFTPEEWDDYVLKRAYINNDCSRLMHSMIQEGYSTEEAARRLKERMIELRQQYYME